MGKVRGHNGMMLDSREARSSWSAGYQNNETHSFLGDSLGKEFPAPKRPPQIRDMGSAIEVNVYISLFLFIPFRVYFQYSEINFLNLISWKQMTKV